MYNEVIITPQIAAWLQVQHSADTRLIQALEVQLDKGEASAIALAGGLANSLLILDDMKARKIAEHLTLKFTGTIGVLIKAKQRAIISKLTPVLTKIKQTDFRLSKELEENALRLAGEL